MSSQRTYIWQAGDQRWFIASRHLAPSGYDSVSELAERLVVANPQIPSWASADIAVGTVITIPYLDS